jgi:methylenetetrahydrofolate reductase (NADPH)
MDLVEGQEIKENVRSSQNEDVSGIEYTEDQNGLADRLFYLGLRKYITGIWKRHRLGSMSLPSVLTLLPSGSGEKNRMSLRTNIQSDQFVVTAELGPPQSCNGEAIRKKSVHFLQGIDGVNITDNQTGIVRLSSIASAKILLEVGLEPIIQMTCRDRNRIAIQSDLLGSAALGIENVLCLTGDHQRFGNHPESKGVFDLDSIQLIAMVYQMTQGKFLSGETMKTVPQFFIGGAANPFADPLEFRVLRLKKKVRAGADFIQTQPIFDLERFDEWLRLVRREGLHEQVAILAGVMPVKSAKALIYMKNEVPGVRIPDRLIHRLESAEDSKEEGIRMAVEIIQELKGMEGLKGIHLMPVMWESITPSILEEAGFRKKDLKTK